MAFSPLLAHHILHINRIGVTCHLLALLGAHHILHVNRIGVKYHLLALLGAHHILHVNRIRVKCHLLALLGAQHILHVSRIRVKSHIVLLFTITSGLTRHRQATRLLLAANGTSGASCFMRCVATSMRIACLSTVYLTIV